VILTLLGILAFIVPQGQAKPPTGEVIAEVRVHGNQIVGDEEVLQIAAITVGTPFSDAVLADATARLKASGKFDTVDVVKRYASIEDPTKILVMIIVNEGPVRIVMSGVAGVMPTIEKRSFLSNLMFIPVLEGSDGYGLTFGARVAYPRIIGRSSRLSVPLLLGGTKRVGLELDRTFVRGPFTRLEFAGAIQRRNNPAYDVNDTRRLFWARGQRAMGPVRVGISTGYQDVTFAEAKDAFSTIGFDVTLDTRRDTALPRNAIQVAAWAERTFLRGGDAITRARVDGRGYIGLFGQHVLMVHLLYEYANAPVPVYMRPILGGFNTLRGFETGFRTGDLLAAGSLEWRVPINSPVRFGRLGITLFSDWGTSWDHGQRIDQVPLFNGIGATAWYSLASFRISVAVANGINSGVRVHFSGGIGF
jgi:outer membrane protein assembly factor BamA